MSKYNIDFDVIEPLDLESLDKSCSSNTDNYSPFHIKNIQYYHPIYSLFKEGKNVKLENPVSLNHPYKIYDCQNVYSLQSKEPIQKSIFTKFAPLIDPLKFLIGKYKDVYDKIRRLPSTNSDSEYHEKLTSIHNASYVDNFFCYLSGQLVSSHNIIHGLEYYGSFLGIQEKYRMNIADDYDYLIESDHFNENKGKLYEIDEDNEEENNVLFAGNSRSNRGKLNIHNDTVISTISLGQDIQDVGNDSMECLEEFEVDNFEESEMKLENIDDDENSELNYSDEENDENEENEENDETEENEENVENEENEENEENDENDEDESTSFEPDPVLNAYFYNFPVQVICQEKCDGTLDELFSKKILDLDTSASALFQVIMTLLIYQKVYHFTHNDLHTQNIMYINTDIEYICYMYKKKYYRVPTYGRIFKIIDFGRAIYRFNGHLFCSDSFSNGGDGHTQYNCEPFLDEKKPRIDPNYSFDICRLGCSIYDYILDIEDELNRNTEKNALEATIIRWVSDDQDKNVLYKKSGEERYPNFKLYKMITRTVHRHLPEEQLKYSYFSQFECKKKEIKGISVIDIDGLPEYI